MKRLPCIMILSGLFLMASTAAAATAYASSCSQGEDNKSGGHAVFGKDFTDMDSDGDDSLSFKEFKNIFPSTEQKAFDRLDNDKNGALSRQEWDQFKEMHKGMGKYHHKKRYHTEKLPEPSLFNAHFPDMDTDHNDQVSFDEFNGHFTDAADKDHVFKAVDLDADGYIDHGEWHEFKAAHGLKHMD